MVTEPAWRRRLRAGGHRVTHQREAILTAITELTHPTAESIHQHLAAREPALNLSTVYRTLAVLQDLGVISHAHVGSGPPVYHLADDPPHVHLSCLDCGRVTSIPASATAEFVAAVAARTGFHCDPTHSAIYGRCADCAAAASA